MSAAISSTFSSNAAPTMTTRGREAPCVASVLEWLISEILLLRRHSSNPDPATALAGSWE